MMSLHEADNMVVLLDHLVSIIVIIGVLWNVREVVLGAVFILLIVVVVHTLLLACAGIT